MAALCNADGKRVNAILVGGDIAYKADPDEYDAAKTWLLRIADMCGCQPSNILTVPGNHDINRATCKKPEVTDAQACIADEVDNNARNRAFLGRLATIEDAKYLFEPLEAYNHFAAQFGCQVFHTHPFWERTLDLGQGVQLRIHGLTSTFISGSGDRDSAPGRLFLGACQYVLDPDPDVVSVVVCHHPPSWFLDASDAENTIEARAQLQFFGHEHDQRCKRVKEYMRFLAGAVNPDRDEPAWRPGYNLVDLAVVGEGAARALEVRAHLRAFQPAPAEFYVAHHSTPDDPLWTHRLQIPAPIRPTFTADPGPHIADASHVRPPQREKKLFSAVQATIDDSHGVQGSANSQIVQSPELKVSEPSTENLVFRFWQLRVDVMREIALSLQLITEADLDVPPHRRYFKALEVAREKGLLVDLAREVEKHEHSA